MSIDLYLPSPWYTLIFYWTWILLFHLIEGCLAWQYRPAQFSIWVSFLITWRYCLFVMLTMLEFCLEAVYWPVSKGLIPCIVVGSIIFFIFWGLRMMAIITAGKSFNHLISEQGVSSTQLEISQQRDTSSEIESSSTHSLITHGVYRFIRHPAYLGYFGIVVGLQILLATPVCFCIGVILTYLFFYIRIPMEEAQLIDRYPEYAQYRKSTLAGIPVFCWQQDE